MRIILLIFLTVLAASCGKSKSPHYFVLTPLPLHPGSKQTQHNLRIGLSEVQIPGFLDKPQLAIFCNKNQSKLDEEHLWAEELRSNVKRVIKTNLEVYLPGSIVEIAPWDTPFDPSYQLKVNIDQFAVDLQGNSVLDADYIIYRQDKFVSSYRASFRQKLSCVTPDTVVRSMNLLLTHLTQEIAQRFVAVRSL